VTQRSVERASLSYRGRRRPSAALACCRWRKAAALMRFWQAAEQNRQVRLREVSTKTRSQLSALQTPSRSAYSLSSAVAKPVAQVAVQLLGWLFSTIVGRGNAPVADHLVTKLVGGQTPRIVDLEAAREPTGCTTA